MIGPLLALFTLSSAQDALAVPPLPKLVAEITRAEIEYHLRTLASDALLGARPARRSRRSPRTTSPTCSRATA